MNPFDEELGETQSVCHKGGVMQVNAIGCDRRSQGGSDEVQPALLSTVSDGGSTVAIGFKAGQSADGGLGDEREVSPTLSHKPSALEPTLAQSGVQCLTPSHPQTHRVYSEQGAFPSLCHNGGEAGQNQQAVLASLSQMRYIVRRLTPTESERLMGLPSGYTIPIGLEVTDELVAEFQRIHDTFGAIMAEYEHAKPPKPKSANQVRAWLEKITDPATCPDSPRYKACGNGWATNQPRWILTRLLAIGEGIAPFSTDFAPGGATASASTTGSESPDRDGAGAANS